MAYLANILDYTYSGMTKLDINIVQHRIGAVPPVADPVYAGLPTTGWIDCFGYDSCLVWWHQVGAGAPPTIDLQPLLLDEDNPGGARWTVQNTIIDNLRPDHAVLINVHDGKLFLRIDAVAAALGITNWEIYVRPLRTRGISAIIDNSMALLLTCIGMVGGPTPIRAILAGGDDGGVLRALGLTAAGAVTEANSASILTSVQLIDDTVAAHDAVRAIKSVLTGGRAYSGNPAPVSASNNQADLLATLLGQLRVYIDSALNRVNDEVKAEDIPPPEIVIGGTNTKVAAVGTPAQLTATSYTLKRGVWVRVSPLMAGAAPGPWVGFHFTAAGNSIWSVATGAWAAGRLTSRDGGELFIPIDDPSKIYFDGPTGGEIIIWSAV